ncbi:MAG: tRNA 2-selenouridine(34) synthase MnmH [Flavobacteriales bacterium]
MTIPTISLAEAWSGSTSSPRLWIDVRSPGEYAAGHIPGAINIPLLNNEERAEVGTIYKQHGRDSAVDAGFRLTGGKFARYVQEAREACSDREAIVYCWRGGLRSAIMSWIFSLSGMHIHQLSGGYKAWRNECLRLFAHPFQILLLSGMTGCGKTAILRQLEQMGEQILDLEKWASHKGSSFGALGQPEQPTQEHFENLLGFGLMNSNDQRRLWIEDESRFIGKLRIPDALLRQMARAPELEVCCTQEERIARILHEYGAFPAEQLSERTVALSRRIGGEQVKSALKRLHEGDLQSWVGILLDYYDKTYLYTRCRRRKDFPEGVVLTAQVGGDDDQSARTIRFVAQQFE